MRVDKVGSAEQFKKLVELYKVQNPVKYEMKKKEFAKKLAELEPNKSKKVVEE